MLIILHMLIIGVAIPIYSEDLRGVFQGRLGAVSYTHLTLPTTERV